MDTEVEQRLEKAIREMLRARMNTHQIRDALAKQSSFGKYDGCTPVAVLERANHICKEMNREENASLRRHLQAYQRNRA